MRWRLPWDDDDPGLPILLTSCATDEYVPGPMSELAGEAVRRAWADCDSNARRTGVSRRQFLLSLCGAATTLLALDACSKEAARHGALPATPGTSPGGSYRVPAEATTEPPVASTVLGGEEFIFDVHNHLLDYTVDSLARTAQPFFGVDFPQAHCGLGDPHGCFSAAQFLELMFLRSDTSMTILSTLPIAPEHSAESLVVRDRVRAVSHALSHDSRVLVHGEAFPTYFGLPATLTAMEQMAAAYPIAGWKIYTHTIGAPWWLDDHEGGVPQVGEAFIRKAIQLGIPRIAVHKGLVTAPYNDPADIGPAAKTHRDATFSVYHAAYQQGVVEGPYTPATAHLGINRLVASMQRAGVGPNENVYADLGTSWFDLLRSPSQAAHAWGKLLRYVGEDNVLWGTDSIWYGAPQDQIQAFRAFQISEEFQSRYGYPALTDQRKAKILGLNALRLYGVQPVPGRPTYTRQQLAKIRLDLPGGNVALGPTTPAQAAALAAGRGPLG